MSSSQHVQNAEKTNWLEVIALVVVYLGLSALVLITKRPWVDEGWFANPAYSFLNHGHWGTTILEEAGTSWMDIQRKTLWNPPGYFVSTAIWSKIFGFSLFSLRAHSLAWGLLGVLSFYFLLARLKRSFSLQPFVSSLFLVTSFFFITSAVDVRMDIPMVALGLLSLWSVLAWENRMQWAVPIGYFLAGISVLFHPHGVLNLIVLSLFILIFYRREIKFIHILSVVPVGLALIGLWVLYVHPDYDAFMAQFRANAQSRFGKYSLVGALVDEVQLRYLHIFGFAPGSTLGSKAKSLILGFYMLAAAWVSLELLKKNHTDKRGAWFFFGSFLLVSVFLTFMQPNKAQYYLNSNLPFLFALLGMFYCAMARRSKLASFAIVTLVLALQAFSVLNIVRKNELKGQFYGACDLIQSFQPRLVFASGEFGFCLGWNGQVIDDLYLGRFSGREADVIVIDERYQTQNSQSFESGDQIFISPKAKRYDLKGNFEKYRIYKEIPAGS